MIFLIKTYKDILKSGYFGIIVCAFGVIFDLSWPGYVEAQTKQVYYLGYDQGRNPVAIVSGIENAVKKFSEISNNDSKYIASYLNDGLGYKHIFSWRKKMIFLIKTSGRIVVGCGESHLRDKKIITTKRVYSGRKYTYAKISDLDKWLSYLDSNPSDYSPYLMCAIRGSLYIFVIKHSDDERPLSTAFIWSDTEKGFNKRLVGLIDKGYLTTHISGLNGWFASLVSTKDNYTDVEAYLVDRAFGIDDVYQSLEKAPRARVFPAFMVEESSSSYFNVVQRPQRDMTVYFGE